MPSFSSSQLAQLSTDSSSPGLTVAPTPTPTAATSFVPTPVSVDLPAYPLAEGEPDKTASSQQQQQLSEPSSSARGSAIPSEDHTYLPCPALDESHLPSQEEAASQDPSLAQDRSLINLLPSVLPLSRTSMTTDVSSAISTVLPSSSSSSSSSAPDRLPLTRHVLHAPSSSPTSSSLSAFSSSSPASSAIPTSSPSSSVASSSSPISKEHKPFDLSPSMSYLPPPDSCPSSGHRIPSAQKGHACIYPGSKFRGTQRSGKNAYNVQVIIKSVDWDEGTLCGFLEIQGLTEEFPWLTTFFEGEIIGPKFSFQTNRWEATAQTDLAHWSKFPLFQPLKPGFQKRDDRKMDDCVVGPAGVVGDVGGESGARGGVFMRWKEKFLVPDHKKSSVEGASFSGFYYICVDFTPSSSSTNTARSPLPSTARPPLSPPPPPFSALQSIRRRWTPSLSSSNPGLDLRMGQNTTFASRLPTPSSRLDVNTQMRELRGNSESDLLRSESMAWFGPPTTSAGRGGTGLDSRETRSAGQSWSRSDARNRPSNHVDLGLQADDESEDEEKYEEDEGGGELMTGFYFHHLNSEPFQQLSLRHVPERGVRPTFHFM